MTIDKCALISYPLKPEEIKSATGPTIEYETEFVGKVKITLAAYQELIQGDFDRYIIAGICKNLSLQNLDPPLIDSDFIRTGYKKYKPPIDFEEKCYQFLKTLYLIGGRENKVFEFNTTKHFPMAYADQEEFARIIDLLDSEYYISIDRTHDLPRRNKIFVGVKMTKFGKEEAQKALPKMPLFGLVNQEISTGDPEIDSKINHARELFFEEPSSMDKMRSACESLSYVLEPLREDLKSYFSQKDISDFFQIVNAFDIRHNKDFTKNIVDVEQLEWVFYTLLNTINTFTKLKQKGV